MKSYAVFASWGLKVANTLYLVFLLVADLTQSSTDSHRHHIPTIFLTLLIGEVKPLPEGFLKTITRRALIRTLTLDQGLKNL